MSVDIWHNPRCSKSRATLALLEKRGIAPQICTYLDNAPSAVAISEVLDMLGCEPREIMRKGEAAYKEQDLDNADLSRDELIAAMANTPILIERPIVIANGQAAIGRPPESVLDIL